MLALLLLVTLIFAPMTFVQAQKPAGLAASALANPSFSWIRRSAPGFRVYFLRDSYPAANQDSLLARLPPALAHARSLIQAPPLDGPIDLFFIESRAHMRALTGAQATGLSQNSTRTILLVTNTDWRAFERHEIMHVVAERSWGPPATDTAWLQEGLAQAADGVCAGYLNADIVLALTRKHGWIPLELVLTKFREQPDVRAYLQAAAFTDYLLKQFGPGPLRDLWGRGATLDSAIGGKTLALLEGHWKQHLTASRKVSRDMIARVESDSMGCG
jgi:hypothetical protein